MQLLVLGSATPNGEPSFAKRTAGDAMKKAGHGFSLASARPAHTRLKAWQQCWLDMHRETMVRRLQGVVMSIVDCLVQDRLMDLDLETYQLISSSHTLPVEKVRQLLDFLRCQSQDAFKCFQAALEQNGCGDLAANEADVKELEAALSSLPRFERCSLELGVPASVVKARRRLHDLFAEQSSDVHMLAGVCRPTDRSTAGGTSSLDDVFVNIGIVSSDVVEKLCSEWTGKDGGWTKCSSKPWKRSKSTYVIF